MKYCWALLACSCLSAHVNAVELSSGGHASPKTELAATQSSRAIENLPTITFQEFFKMPVGPRGLDISSKLSSLNNKRVRITGYVAQEDDPTPGIFMLTPHPVNVGEKADGMADDLPASTLFVHMPPKDADKVLAYRPAPWVLTGTLQVGNQEEANGRTSVVRLIMDSRDIAPVKTTTTIQ